MKVFALLGIMYCNTVYGCMYMMDDNYKKLSNEQAIRYSKCQMTYRPTIVVITLLYYVALRIIRAMNSEISLNRTLEDII